MSKPEHTNVAANKADNDAFAVYNDVDVNALQDEAIKQSVAADASSRKETQMQVANILARYQQNKLIMDSNPEKLYTVDKHGTHTFQVATAKIITRIVYDCPEKDTDGNKQVLPQYLLARIRRISPLVFFAIQQRIPLVWCAKRKALAVPRWMTVSDDALLEPFWKTPEKRTGYNDPVYLDGKQGRTLDSIVKRVEKHQKPEPVERGTNSTPQHTDSLTLKIRGAIASVGLEKSLEAIADVFTRCDHDKPFSDAIVELVATCCEHINVRNGKDALGKAVAELSDEPSKPIKRIAA